MRELAIELDRDLVETPEGESGREVEVCAIRRLCLNVMVRASRVALIGEDPLSTSEFESGMKTLGRRRVGLFFYT